MRNREEFPEEYHRVYRKLEKMMSQFDDGTSKGTPVDLDNLEKQVGAILDEGESDYPITVTDDGDVIEHFDKYTVGQRKASDVQFRIQHEQERIDEASIPHYSNWVRAGMIDEASKSGGLVKMPDNKDGRAFGGAEHNFKNAEDNRKMRDTLFQAYGVTASDLESYNKVQTAYAELRDEHLARLYVNAQEQFLARYGDLDLKSVTEDIGKDFINYLADPNQYKSKRRQQLGSKTIKNKLGYVRAILEWAVRNNYIKSNEHGLSGLSTARRGRPPEERELYTDSQYLQLFSLQNKKPEELNYLGKKTVRFGLGKSKPYRPEMMLILQIIACTGMRLEEAGALQWKDIKEESVEPEGDEVTCFIDLTGEGKKLKGFKGQSKNAKRRVPIVDVLLPYIQAYQTNFEPVDPEAYLFAHFFRFNSDGKLSDEASDQVMPYIYEVRTHEKQFLDIHSMRHTFRFICNDEDTMEESMIDCLCGWEFVGMGKVYNTRSAYKLKKLSDAMNRLKLSFVTVVDKERLIKTSSNVGDT